MGRKKGRGRKRRGGSGVGGGIKEEREINTYCHKNHRADSPKTLLTLLVSKTFIITFPVKFFLQ